MSRFIALHCGDESAALISKHPNAFLLLTQIAMRAKWKDCTITRLKAGQAFIGDWREAGLRSEKAYRHAKEILTDCGLATFKGANKGTIATLADSRVFSVSADARGGQTGEQGDSPGASKGRTRGEQGASNNTDTQSTQSTLIPLPGGESGGEHVLPNGWQRMTATQRKQARVNANSKGMNRIGKLLGRREGTLWTVAEALALKSVNPAPEEIELLETYYLASGIDPEKDIRRKDLITLLNNWTGELDRARIFKSNL